MITSITWCTCSRKIKTGYRNLMELVSAGYLEGFYYKPRVDRELLKSIPKG